MQDPDATDRIYAIKGEFLKASWYKQFIPNVQNVFSTTDVDYHRRHRRLLASEISESGLAPHRATVDSKIRLAIERMAEEMEERGATVSLSEKVTKWKGQWLISWFCVRRMYFAGSCTWRRTLSAS